MTESIGKAREFGDVESALNYLDGWGEVNLKDWEIVYGEVEQSRQIYHRNEKVIPKENPDAFDYLKENILGQIRNTFNPWQCKNCKGFGRVYGCTNYRDCEVCGGTGQKAPTPNFPKGGIDYTGTYLNLNYDFYATPAPENIEGTLRYEPEKEFYTQFNPDKHVKLKSITDLCKEADLFRNDYRKLQHIKEELFSNKDHYSEINFNFAREHIDTYVNELRERHEKAKVGNRFNEE